jgi:hypothetical protein
MNLEWHEIGPDQPLMAEAGNLTIYKFADGHASCAESNTWISALFTSPEAVLSWRDDFDAAEEAFRAMNQPTGKGPNLLGEKR